MNACVTTALESVEVSREGELCPRHLECVSPTTRVKLERARARVDAACGTAESHEAHQELREEIAEAVAEARRVDRRWTRWGVCWGEKMAPFKELERAVKHWAKLTRGGLCASIVCGETGDVLTVETAQAACPHEVLAWDKTVLGSGDNLHDALRDAFAHAPRFGSGETWPGGGAPPIVRNCWIKHTLSWAHANRVAARTGMASAAA